MKFMLHRKIARNLREKGVRGTLALVVPFLQRARPAVRRRNEQERTFDALYGTDTAGYIARDDLGIGDRDVREQCESYEPTKVWILKRIFEDLPIRFQDYVLVDIGSGKGRTLLIASEYPFKKIVGIEISSRLNAIAVANLQRYQRDSRRCDYVVSTCINATEFRLPDENLVVYLYNPFHENLLTELLSNIDASLKQLPRDFFLVYVNPVHHDLIEARGFVRLLKKTKRHRVYTNVGRV